MRRALFFLVIFFSIQSTSVAAEKSVNICGGRYQYFEGVAPEVFDSETGKVYVWFPRDEKKGENPYIFVRDAINGKGVRVEIKFIEETVVHRK